MSKHKKTYIGSGKTSCITTYRKITLTPQISIKNNTTHHLISNINTKQQIITQQIT